MVTEPVDAHNLINSLGFLPPNPDLVTWNNIPVFDTVLWFGGLDNWIPESYPPLPVPVIRKEVTESFGVRFGRPGLEDLVPPEHFRDWHR